MPNITAMTTSTFKKYRSVLHAQNHQWPIMVDPLHTVGSPLHACRPCQDPTKTIHVHADSFI